MPKTRGESIFFTAITAWMMVYVGPAARFIFRTTSRYLEQYR